MILERSILKTLQYSAIFNFPLNTKEVYKYLISNDPYPYKNVKTQLKHLTDTKKIKMLDGYYGNKGLSDSVFAQRKISAITSKKALKQTEKDLDLISKLPFVRFIGVTGSVAAKNASKNYDTDLFIITSHNFLWTTRLLVTLVLKLKKQYRSVYCPNIYLGCGNLTWPKQNIYIANEIARLTPVYNKKHTYELFLHKNTWVFKAIPNFAKYVSHINTKYKPSLLCKLFFVPEFILFKLQYFYMKSRITSERVNLKFIHFLKNDYSSKILKKAKVI